MSSDSKQKNEDSPRVKVPKGPGAPIDFGTKLENRLRERSAGRFFGKSSLAEKVPFVALAVALMFVAGLIYWLQRDSATGTLPPIESSLSTDASQIQA